MMEIAKSDLILYSKHTSNLCSLFMHFLYKVKHGGQSSESQEIE